MNQVPRNLDGSRCPICHLFTAPSCDGRLIPFALGATTASALGVPRMREIMCTPHRSAFLLAQVQAVASTGTPVAVPGDAGEFVPEFRLASQPSTIPSPPIPEEMLESLRLWCEKAEPHPKLLGSFMRAVLTNNLVHAFAHADEHNAAAMRSWAFALYNDVPSQAYGSEEKLQAWYDAHHPKVDQ